MHLQLCWVWVKVQHSHLQEIISRQANLLPHSEAATANPQMLPEHNLLRLYQTNPLFCYQQIVLFDVFSRVPSKSDLKMK